MSGRLHRRRTPTLKIACREDVLLHLIFRVRDVQPETIVVCQRTECETLPDQLGKTGGRDGTTADVKLLKQYSRNTSRSRLISGSKGREKGSVSPPMQRGLAYKHGVPGRITRGDCLGDER